MITKTVTSGERSAAATISEETKFVFSDKWNFFHVQNMGTGNVYISMTEGKAGGDDGAITVLPGCTACSSHNFPANSVYITAASATDSVQVVGSNSAFLPFKSGSGGGDIDLSPYVKKTDLDVGGTNLLVNSGWINNTNGWWIDAPLARDPSVQLNGCTSCKISRTGLSADSPKHVTGSSPSNFTPAKLGDTFTFSVWLKTDDYTKVDKSVRILIDLRGGSNNYLTSFNSYVTMTVNNTWVKATLTGTITNPNCVYVSPGAGMNRNGTLWIACPKLERGSIATDYSPSPKDLIGTPVTLFSGTPSTSSGTPSTISNGTFDGYRNIIIEYTNGSSVAIATDLIYGVGKVCAYHADGSTIDTITFVSSSTFYVSSAKTGTYKIYGVV